MYFYRAFQWYHSYADPIWPEGTFNFLKLNRSHLLFETTYFEELRPLGITAQNPRGPCKIKIIEEVRVTWSGM